MMNSPGLPLTISLVMARAAGVEDKQLPQAIELSSRLMRFYIGKGAIPYGDHPAWMETHDDNGKCGMATMLFQLLGEAKGADFFARMSLASHGSERDCGHTGNFFNMLWSLPAAAQNGPQATGACGIRLAGLEVLASHRIKEGIQACADYNRNQNPWATPERIHDILTIRVTYGAAEHPVLPHLRETAVVFDAGEKDFPKNVSKQKAEALRKGMAKSEASPDRPELNHIR